MPTHIALLRGINVGKAKRVAMAELREVVTGLGYSNSRTLLNSGNVVFDSPRKLSSSSAQAMRDALEARTGVRSAITIISAVDLATIVAENSLVEAITDPARCLVAFPATLADLARTAVLSGSDRSPDRFAIGTRAAYLWCATGILESKLLKEFSRLIGEAVTTRNWATVLKLHEMSR
jgi:uncharacterized protein (DUF1697 family)